MISLPLAVDDVVDVDVEGVSCDHTTTIVDAKSWRMKNSKRMGRCKKFIVLVQGQAGTKRQSNRKLGLGKRLLS